MDTTELLNIISTGETSEEHFQRSGNLLADEMEVYGTSIQDVNVPEFEEYFRREFNMSYEEAGLTLEQALKSKRWYTGTTSRTPPSA